MPKLLTRRKTKTKEQRQQEHQDALQRTHLADAASKPLAEEDQFGKGGLEEYYAAKQEAKESGAAVPGMPGFADSQREQERYLSKYESAHASNFASLRNVDEDDDDLGAGRPGVAGAQGEDDMQFNDMRKDFGNYMELDEDGFDMPTRAQRSKAFNEEIDIGEFRAQEAAKEIEAKDTKAKGTNELPAVIIEDGDSDGDPFAELVSEPGLY